jgi:hypothetical protein
LTDQIRSRYDTTLGIVHYEVPAIAIPELRDLIGDARRRRHDSSESREEYMNLLSAYVETNHYPLVAHEWAHVLQALTHPALLHRCLREFSLMMTILDGVRRTPIPLTLPLIPDSAWRDELDWSTHRRRLLIDANDEPSVAPADPLWPTPADLSELDLLEDSASVLQYKAEIGGQGSGRLYRRWLNEQARYRRTFDFLADQLGTEDGYVALPSLVMGANATNQPVETFVALVAATRRHGIAAARIGIDRYWDFVTTFLRLTVPRGEPRHPQELFEETDPTISIDRMGMLKMVDDLPHHPLSWIVRETCADERRLDLLRATILHPYRAFDRRLRRSADWLRDFAPPVIAYRLVEDGAAQGDELLSISGVLMDEQPPGGAEHWVQYLMEAIRIRNFTFATVESALRAETHNCVHTECPHHSVGMCREWNQVPVAHEECKFPEWLRTSCLRSYDFEREVLVQVLKGD